MKHKKTMAVRPIKQRTFKGECVLTIASTPANSPEFNNRISFLRGRLERVKDAFAQKGFHWFKTAWATDLIERELTKVEKKLGLK
jgi:hypothetical protein